MLFLNLGHEHIPHNLGAIAGTLGLARRYIPDFLVLAFVDLYVLSSELEISM